jgi:FkbM family methyltransferase
MRNFLKSCAGIVASIIPVPFLEGIERLGAYFSGKGSGSTSLGAEVGAALRFTKGDNLVVLDVGANKGYWTEELLRRAGSRIRAIYQFEPSPHNIEILREKFSKDSRIVLVPHAVSDRAGEADLFSDVPGSGMASLHKRKLDHANISFEESSHIATVTIDEIIEKYGISNIDFMKMDIEGHELAALKGAEKSLKASMISALSFEFGGCNIDSRTFFQDYWYLLTGLGYVIFRITPSGSTYRIRGYKETLEYFLTTNYIAVRKDVLGE